MKSETRILDYIDEMAPPVNSEEAIARRHEPNSGPGRGLAWALAGLTVVLAVAGLYIAFSGEDGQVVDQTTPPTPATVPATSALDPTTVPTSVSTPTTVLDVETAKATDSNAAKRSIAHAFLDARNAYDAEAAIALFGDDDHTHDYDNPIITGRDMYPALFEWLRVTGWQWTVDVCFVVIGQANTRCTYLVENAWSRALGLAPAQGEIRLEIYGPMYLVPDFKVLPTDSRYGDLWNAQIAEVWETVIDWIRANHPQDLEAMIRTEYNRPVGPVLDARSIELWRLYTEEFVEAVE